MAVTTEAGSGASAGVPAGGLPPIPAPHRRRPWLGSRRRQIVAGLIILGALSYLLVQGLSNATVYFKTADQAVADKAKLGTSTFRIEGTVQNDVRKVGNDTDFNIYANNVTVSVVATGQPSQLFQPNIPVVLEGHWAGDVFSASEIMVKHSASYSEAHPDRLKPQTPATVPGGVSGTSGSGS